MNKVGNHTILHLVLIALCVTISGCASTPPSATELVAREEANDPLEPMNRSFFKLNNAIDNYAVEPTARAYGKVLPKQVRDGFRNFSRNMGEPVTFANDLLQGEFKRAGVSLGRFTINSTMGFFGFNDAAKEFGLRYHHEDFGQTLAVWGLPEGPYLYFPVVGPMPPRDLIGAVADIFANPLFWANEPVVDGVLIGNGVVSGVDVRERNLENLDRLEETSVDYYASLRSLYRQRRNYEIRNGEDNYEDLPNLQEFE